MLKKMRFDVSSNLPKDIQTDDRSKITKVKSYNGNLFYLFGFSKLSFFHISAAGAGLNDGKCDLF